jgi:aminoglycoside 3'-phosphotransferase I
MPTGFNEPSNLPSSLRPLVEDCSWSPSALGKSGDAVYRLDHKSDHRELYLKCAQAHQAQELADEMVRLRWLAHHITVPSVVHFAASEDEAWLLMTALPGQTASERMAHAGPIERRAIVDALARFVSQLHAIPTEGCPFDARHVLRMATAKARLEKGLVDAEDFDVERQGQTATQIWEHMQALLPFTPDSVVTHGDLTLDNIMMEGANVVGCIDVGRAGIADRYQDIALLWRSLESDPDLQARFLMAMGIGEVDDRKLRFHITLDEFF